jgi:hypothetical protein
MELRQGSRKPTRYHASCEHPVMGRIALELSNVSRVGFMVEARAGVMRGDRITVSLTPNNGLGAICLWTRYQCAGFQFDCVIPEEVMESLAA